MSPKHSSGQTEREPDGRTPALEWISAALGLLITLAILAFIGWQALAGPDEVPPAIEVTVRQVVPLPGGYVVEVVARNVSPSTAANVQIEGRLERQGQTVATSRATLDYVPGHSERQGGLFFEEDPRAHDLGLRALGYARP